MVKTKINRLAKAPGTDRCLAILELLSQQSQGLTLSQISQSLEISKNMVFRVLNDLSVRGYVFRDDDKSFFLGKKLLQLAIPRVSEKNLVDESMSEIKALRNACGEGVGLVIPSGGEGILIYFQPSPKPIRTIYDLGIRISLYSSAPGKVFLAFGAEQERLHRLKQQSFQRLTARTITDPANLQVELEQARQDGYTVDLAEGIEGNHCVAAPVFDGDDRLLAAIVITGPSERMPEVRLPEFGQLVAATAAHITHRIKI
jgi:DNA-binding IclR family transcriptional regulator